MQVQIFRKSLVELIYPEFQAFSTGLLTSIVSAKLRGKTFEDPVEIQVKGRWEDKVMY
jgi:hypothetical protein